MVSGRPGIVVAPSFFYRLSEPISYPNAAVDIIESASILGRAAKGFLGGWCFEAYHPILWGDWVFGIHPKSIS
jgi:hypothetical protein